MRWWLIRWMPCGLNLDSVNGFAFYWYVCDSHNSKIDASSIIQYGSLACTSLHIKSISTNRPDATISQDGNLDCGDITCSGITINHVTFKPPYRKRSTKECQSFI